MGVDVTTYVIFGCELGKKPSEIEFDDFQEEIEGGPNRRFDMIMDDMGDDYVMVGLILGSTTKYDEGFDILDMAGMLEKLPQTLKNINEAFGTNETHAKFNFFLFNNFH